MKRGTVCRRFQILHISQKSEKRTGWNQKRLMVSIGLFRENGLFYSGLALRTVFRYIRIGIICDRASIISFVLQVFLGLIPPRHRNKHQCRYRHRRKR